ncbi:glycosyltransferase [Roseovarius nanhaiticus]|uniref:glycosyltransferase n=1 Tax=Roseovarius nanhaiticus TaxID=573024 RepID=UPI0024936E0E|nr:glycosyltransferase [Roseovarius nanhaiticus]
MSEGIDCVTAPLQSLIWPDPDLCTERDLYMRLDGAAALSMNAQEIRFAPGGGANFNTYANLFNSGKWAKYCDLDQLSLHLEGGGTFELVVFSAHPDHSYIRLINEVITLEAGITQLFDVTPGAGFENRGALYFQLRALSDGVLRRADWHTNRAPRRTPNLMLSITTFKREEAVRRTVARFERFMSETPLKAHLHLAVVDNGKSAKIVSSPNVTLIPNENLGGAGGFARGLIEAQNRGATHCLFMDDDAANHPGAIERTWMFLAHATDDRLAISGALANAQHRWQMWENGAVFDRLCHPQFQGRDLRCAEDVLDMEFASTGEKPDNFYGGWWFFAFPLAHVDHMPFPFFVRGDDVSFSLMNDFQIVNLPGVISFQDEDFSSKESPQTLYLDLRGHLAHHLVAPGLDIGRTGVLRILGWFFIRSFLSCHYETLAALNLSVRDAISGPEFFAENADLAGRRADIKANMQNEVWHDLTTDPPAEKRRFDPDRRRDRALMKLTLNGHLFPFFGRVGNHVTLPSALRGHRRPLWGAARITYVSPDRSRAYTVRHDKRRAWREMTRALWAIFVMWRDYPQIKARWRQGYDTLTQGPFWTEILQIDKTQSAGGPTLVKEAPDMRRSA